MGEPSNNTNQLVEKVLSKSNVVLMIGQGSSAEEHTSMNKIMKKPALWRWTWLVAQQSVRDIYRLPELDSEYTLPGFMSLIRSLTYCGKRVYVMSDIIDGFFERCSLQNLAFYNLCGSVEKMYEYSEMRAPPNNWYNTLKEGVDSQVIEECRSVLQNIDDAYFITIGVSGNKNLALLEGISRQKTCTIGFEKEKIEPGRYQYQFSGDLDEILTGFAGAILSNKDLFQ